MKITSSMDDTADKFAIFEMAYKFSDACNRNDGEMFAGLWADDGAQWIIGPPMSQTFAGKAHMAEAVTKMLDLWEFFVQAVVGGVVILDGDRAYARFYTQEYANGKDGTGNHNLSMYEDELVKINGAWLFKVRNYDTVFQSSQRQVGSVFAVPKLPKEYREKVLNS